MFSDTTTTEWVAQPLPSTVEPNHLVFAVGKVPPMRAEE